MQRTERLSRPLRRPKHDHPVRSHFVYWKNRWPGAPRDRLGAVASNPHGLSGVLRALLAFGSGDPETHMEVDDELKRMTTDELWELHQRLSIVLERKLEDYVRELERRLEK